MTDIAAAQDFVEQHWDVPISSVTKRKYSDFAVTPEGIHCVTSDGQWEYALVFEVPAAVRNSKSKVVITLDIDVARGAVGVGAVQDDGSTYICEEVFRAGDLDNALIVPAAKVERLSMLVLRNTAPGGTRTVFNIRSLRIYTTDVPDAASLVEVTNKPFKPRADRNRPFKLASINTTEVCNLSCVMCHFNGPNAIKKSGNLNSSQVLKALDNIPSGQSVWFASTGEFFIDKNAVSYLRAATERGLKPCVLSHGQMFTPELVDDILEAGVRFVRMSVDSTDENQYRKIRRGGELRNIIEACKLFRRKKLEQYPDLRVEINATLFRNTFAKQREMENFWRGLVDQVNFNAEYFDTFQFRNTFFIPEKRVDCDLQLYLMPSGRIAPCCAIAVYQHENDVSWLPHIDEVESLQSAHEQLSDMYEDPNGPMSEICGKCDWWILSMSGNSPYIRPVDLASTRNSED
ncbi:radical SAM protein [Tardiphaga sp. 709]|uniref:radical SAM protein n=1 Tax=Tardiphaga sp. 709 TaxID=3076039 RepID=UPI0028EEBAD9|nr:radical SAM protein [Tardiphaga sp. 709]WNV09600.1 radical SAM protein [Tardiphaga sp. 709]